MNPERITLVQESFARVLPEAEALTERVYDRLFEIDPSLRAMFRGDMARQKAMLSVALATVVHGLRFPDRIVPVLHDLGRRHLDHGVRTEHYDMVGEALLSALGATLGEERRSEVMDAWADAYGLIASSMLEGAEAAAAERAA